MVPSNPRAHRASASTMSGNWAVFSLPFLDQNRARGALPPTTSAIARMPSYFGSYSRSLLSIGGSGSPPTASIGRRVRASTKEGQVPSGVAVFEPGFGRVRVASRFPEAKLLLVQEVDAANPLRALP